MITQYLLVSIIITLGFLLVYTKIYDYNHRIYGGVFVFIGISGIVSAPFLFNELDSPVYFFTSFLLGCGSILLGFTELKTGQIQSLYRITTVTIFTLGTYFLSVFVPVIRKTLIETVAYHTYYILSSVLHYSVNLTSGPVYSYTSEIVFTNTTPTFVTYIDIACTGVGAIALVWGIITIFDTTVIQKSIYMISSAIIIYILNLIRNIFIAISFAEQWFSGTILQKIVFFTGHTNEKLVSFVIAESFIGQIMSAVLLFIGLYIIVMKTSLLEEFFSDLEEDFSLSYSYFSELKLF